MVVLYWLFIGSGISFGSSDQVCSAVITQAKNPISGVVREFPNPCEVPVGWEKVDQQKLL